MVIVDVQVSHPSRLGDGRLTPIQLINNPVELTAVPYPLPFLIRGASLAQACREESASKDPQKPGR